VTLYACDVCILVFSTGMWVQPEKKPAAGWESVRGWLMRCFMSSRQPWAPVRSTARFDLSLPCLSTKVLCIQRSTTESSSRFSWVFFTPEPFSTQHLSTFSLLNVRWEWKHYAEYAKTPLWKKAQFCCKKACLDQLSLRRHAHRPPTVRSLNIWWISLTKLEIAFPNLCCISQKPIMDASDQHSPAIMCSLRP